MEISYNQMHQGLFKIQISLISQSKMQLIDQINLVISDLQLFGYFTFILLTSMLYFDNGLLAVNHR